jgi:hypothetical protein
MTEFPIQTLPKDVLDYIEALEDSNGMVPEYLCSAALSTFSTIIGNSAKLVVDSEWHVGCALWIAILGDSGTKKTPAIKAMSRYLTAHDDEAYERFLTEQAEYKAKSEFDENASIPKRSRLTLDDATMESTLQELNNNPHGLMIKRDELFGFIQDLSRYRSGGDEQRMLSIFSGDSVDVARKSSAGIRIKKPFLSLIGGIQPGLIDKLLTTDRQVSGFTSRLLFVFPKSPLITRGLGKDTAPKKEAYFEFCAHIHAMAKHHESRLERAFEICLSTDASNHFNEWRDKFIYPKLNDNSSNAIKSYVMKLEEYALRFALILDIIWEEQFNSMISERSMRYAIEICQYYFAQFTRVLTQLFTENKNEDYTVLKQFHESVKGGLTQTEYRETIVKIGINNPNISAKVIASTFGIAKGTLSGWKNPK